MHVLRGSCIKWRYKCKTYCMKIAIWKSTIWYSFIIVKYSVSNKFVCIFALLLRNLRRSKSSWGQHGAHLGPVGPRWAPCWPHDMMTSSNGNSFRVTGHLCGEFTGPRWIPHTKASDAGLWCFLDLRPKKRLSKQPWGWWFETLSRPLWRHHNGTLLSGLVYVPGT